MFSIGCERSGYFLYVTLIRISRRIFLYREKKIEIDSDNKIEYKILNIKYKKKDARSVSSTSRVMAPLVAGVQL